MQERKNSMEDDEYWAYEAERKESTSLEPLVG